MTNYRYGFAFASEMKALLQLPDFPRKINYDALGEVFSFNYCIPPHTCFEGINHLEPGNYMLFEVEKEPVKKRYWQWPFAEDKYTPSMEEFGDLLDDAVKIQMRFDVKGGLYLSGGVDSSVTASHLVNHWSKDKLEAVGLNFSESRYSEYKYSQEASKELSIPLSEALIKPEIIPDLAEKVSYHTEQPHGDFSFFLFYVLSKRAHEEGKIVMFTGDGPDEMALGYRHNTEYFLKSGEFDIGEYSKLLIYMDDKNKKLLLNPDFAENIKAPVQKIRETVEPWKKLHPVDQIGAFECNSLLQANSLPKVERMGAAWATEVRSPFLDHRVTEMLVRLPPEQKLSDGHGKYFLKEYAATRYPRELIFKKKAMPTTPIGEWVKGGLYDWARGVISSADENLVNVDNALNMLDKHKAGEINFTRQLRTILMTTLWQKIFLGT